MNNTAKYRPSLTASQIVKIISLAKTESPLSIDSMSIIGTLAPFAAKIETGVARANPIAPVLTDNTVPIVLSDTGMDRLTKDIIESYPQDSYNLYRADPEECTMSQIQAALEYAYLNDLMSQKELHTYEAQAATGADISPDLDI